MPTTFTHDLFGKQVCQKLPEDLQELLGRNEQAYRIGLHGPDILFYYQVFSKNEVNGLGYRMHQEPADAFFQNCRKLAREDEETAAYVLGFLCHFMLDSTCHPYIAKYQKKTGAGHDEIETDLDRVLMEKTGKNPFTYHPAAFVRPTPELSRKIAAVFGGRVSEKQVTTALCSMKSLTGIMVCRVQMKRDLILGVLKLLGCYDSLQGHIMRKNRCKRCETSTRELLELIRVSIPETVCIVEEYWNTLAEDGEGNPRLARNYE
ncbi:MAG: zinc dependent phospholipase C family protein [Eubacteriales bacterium]|nr:zinc dependent phospholipase C family protein [Eubacteriales bacterium]